MKQVQIELSNIQSCALEGINIIMEENVCYVERWGGKAEEEEEEEWLNNMGRTRK